MFSVMWSEHCSLQELEAAAPDPADRGPRASSPGPARTPASISIGDGLAVAFKIEIAQPPVRGRAVPGRRDRRRRHPPRHLHDGRPADRGARRAALRRSGRPANPSPGRRRRRAASAATATASACRRSAASSCFDPSYSGNPLVNVMAIGLLREERLTLASAPGPGNLVVLYGSATGRDGIGGASVLASATFTDDDPSKRPSVQVGGFRAGGQQIALDESDHEKYQACLTTTSIALPLCLTCCSTVEAAPLSQHAMPSTTSIRSCLCTSASAS